MNFKSILSKFDVFGVPVQMKFNDNAHNYQSVVGGLSSLCLVILSFGYGAYIFSLRYQGLLEPIANQLSYITDFRHLQFDQSLFKVSFQKNDQNSIDPFISQGNILLPVLMKTSQTNELISLAVLLNDSDTAKNDFHSREIDSQIRLEFLKQANRSPSSTQYQYFLLIIQCQEELLSAGQFCANQSQIDDFFNQSGNTIIFDYQFETLNTLTFEKSVMLDRLYINLERSVCYLQDSDLKSTNYAVNNYLLFGNPRMIELIDDQRLQSQTQTIEYCQNYFFGLTTYIGAYFQFRNLQTQKVVSYPTLGCLLAEIGSIISVLFLTRYLIIMLNQHLLLQLILDELTEFFYPEIKLIEVIYDWKRSIKQVSFKGKQIDTKRYLKFKKKTYDIMHAKYTYRNIIYELSRMQFVLLSLQNKNSIRQSHNVGIRLNFIKDEEDSYQNKCLVDEDCYIFSYRNKDQYRNHTFENECSEDFYHINRLKANDSRQIRYPSSDSVKVIELQDSNDVTRSPNLDL